MAFGIATPALARRIAVTPFPSNGGVSKTVFLRRAYSFEQVPPFSSVKNKSRVR
jgi:hypothetical protein